MASSRRSKTNTGGNNNKRDDRVEDMDPPTFALPDNFDHDRYELWTVRLPRNMVNPAASLHGVTIPLDDDDDRALQQQQQTQLTFRDQKDQDYTLQFGSAVENESFRLLLASSTTLSAAAAAASSNNNNSDSSSSDDDDSDNNNDSNGGNNKSKFLYPCRRPFDRHVQITRTIPDVHPMDLAPTQDKAPEAQNDVLRHAYSAIPQKQGLKRRWRPPGANAMVAATSSGSTARVVVVKKEEEEQHKAASAAVVVKMEHDNKNDTVKTEQDDPSLKRKAKKAEKKAKKKSKKRKKEKKSS